MSDPQRPMDSNSEASFRRTDDGGSRGFLQLAEEHRREGRLSEVVEVLQEGLEKHPDHIAAQVALGRCWLEMDEAERAYQILNKVIDRDVTHLVAAKLLVEAHIRRSDPVQARRQLDLYSVLNSTDPDIEPLRRRIEAMQLTDSGEAATPDDGENGADSALDQPRPANKPTAWEEEAAFPDFAPNGSPSAATSPPSEGTGKLFTFPPHHREIYLDGLASEGLFPIAAPPEPEPEPTPELDPESAGESLGPPVIEATETAAPETEQMAAFKAEPVLEPPPAQPANTSTLGELYLQQGHDREAAAIFREVLAKEPKDERALRGLEAAETSASDSELIDGELTDGKLTDAGRLVARLLAEGEGPTVSNLGPLQQRQTLLTRYLGLLRRSPEHDVS